MVGVDPIRVLAQHHSSGQPSVEVLDGYCVLYTNTLARCSMIVRSSTTALAPGEAARA